MAKARVLAVVGVKAKEGELVYYKDGKLMAVKANRGGKKGRKTCGVKKAAKKKVAKKVAPKKMAKRTNKKATPKKTTTKRKATKQLKLFK